MNKKFIALGTVAVVAVGVLAYTFSDGSIFQGRLVYNSDAPVQSDFQKEYCIDPDEYYEKYEKPNENNAGTDSETSEEGEDSGSSEGEGQKRGTESGDEEENSEDKIVIELPGSLGSRGGSGMVKDTEWATEPEPPEVNEKTEYVDCDCKKGQEFGDIVSIEGNIVYKCGGGDWAKKCLRNTYICPEDKKLDDGKLNDLCQSVKVKSCFSAKMPPATDIAICKAYSGWIMAKPCVSNDLCKEYSSWFNDGTFTATVNAMSKEDKAEALSNAEACPYLYDDVDNNAATKDK